MASKQFDFKKLRESLLSPKGSKVLLIAGFAGIALIAVSSFLPLGGGSTAAAATASSAPSVSGSVQDYAKNLDAQLEKILGSISGVGHAEVMVTFSEGERTVYQQQKKTARGHTADVQSGQSQTGESESVEEDTVLLNSDGGESPLVTAHVLPTIKGVLVVCEGGGNTQVQESIVNAVATALDLPTNHIFVTQKTPG